MNTSLFSCFAGRPSRRGKTGKKVDWLVWPFAQDGARGSLVLGYYRLALPGRQMEPSYGGWYEIEL